METPFTSLAARVAAHYGRFAAVEAVALAGSQTTAAADSGSDIDLYVYLRHELPASDRAAVAAAFADEMEVDNRFWEPGDEWIDRQSGIHVDVMFRHASWIEDQLARVLHDCEASVGYSTCFWHNLLSSRALFDRSGWFAALQAKAGQPYPEALRRAIVAKNFPILRDTLSSYRYQLDRALKRGDRVSVNHRVAALLASYFDVLFAVNRQPHPGEKRLLLLAETRCGRLPAGMKEHVERLLEARSEDVLKRVDSLVEGLETLLRAEDLLE